MNTFAHKNSEHQGRAVDAGSVQRKSHVNQTLQLTDERPATLIQRALSESLNQSAKVQSQVQLQQMFDQSPRIAAQMKLAEVLPGRRSTLQRQEMMEDEEPLQGKLEAVQREQTPEEEEPLQAKTEPVQKKNNMGLPDGLKAGVEHLSGISMDDVKVHYNSSAPETVQALAYTQGTEIHVAPGQDKHLAHEAWHVAQQKQGRVKPTIQVKGVSINDDTGLEREADVMGRSAEQSGTGLLQRKDIDDAHAVNNNLTPMRTLQKACVCGQQREDGEPAQLLQAGSPSGATTAVVQRDACYVPKQKTPYSGLTVMGSIGPGEKFDPNQRYPILNQNFKGQQNTIKFGGPVDIQEDDSTHEMLIDTGTISNADAAVDHVVPQALGGCNTPQNAQVLSVSNNSSKGDTYPWGSYSGSLIYDVGTKGMYSNAKAARSDGAVMTTLDKHYAMQP